MTLDDYIKLTCFFMLLGAGFYGILELLAFGISRALHLLKDMMQ